MKKMNRRTKVLILTATMAALLIAVYAFGVLIPESAYASSFMNAKQPPSWEHPFGTDSLGRDLLMRTLKGMSISMTVGLVASIISAVIAVFVGIAAATGSKRVDAFINWTIDLVMGVPHTILVILISFAFGRGLKGLLFGIAATHWMAHDCVWPVRVKPAPMVGQRGIFMSMCMCGPIKDLNVVAVI